jgi:hypothetical protein
MTLTIDDLLNSLKNPNKTTLENTKETWERIKKGDTFSEIDMGSSKLNEFLKEWISSNPYSAIQ